MEEQLQRGIASLESYNHQYSDELNDWMTRCLQNTPTYRPTTDRLLHGVSGVAQGLLKRMGGAAAFADMEVTF
jgi:hypothetical protein